VLTRRRALWTGATTLLVAGCGGKTARLLAGDPHDLRILSAALEAERAQVALYDAGVQIGAGPIARQILGQEHAHEAAIEEAIRELGGAPAAARPAADYTRGIPRGLDAWRRHAIAAEQQWSAGYAAAIPRLVNPRLRSTFAALMTTEAEHGVALDTAP
jgi:hypothetical protein